MTSEQSRLRILRLRQVCDACGLSPSTIRRRVAAGDFPSPIRLGGNAVGWIEEEVQEWIASRQRVSSRREEGGGK